MDSKAWEAAIITVQVVSGVAIVGNLLVLAVFATTKQLRNKYYGFVVSLVLTHIVQATVAFVYEYQMGSTVLSVLRTSYFAVELNIVAVAVNRLLALSITPPARYDVIVTCGRIVVTCLLIWVVSALLYIPTTYIESQIIWLVRPLIALIILLVTGFLYFLVFRKIAQYRESLASSPGVSVDNEDSDNSLRVRQTRHLMVTFTIILVTCLVCWLPQCTGNLMIFVSGKGWYGQSQSFKVFLKFSLAIVVMSSALNPIIYLWRFREIREGLNRLLYLRCNQQTPDAEVESVTMQTVQD